MDMIGHGCAPKTVRHEPCDFEYRVRVGRFVSHSRWDSGKAGDMREGRSRGESLLGAFYGFATRQGETLDQERSVLAAQSPGLSAWQTPQGFGTLSSSVSFGVMNLKVWARTLVSASSCSILGM